MDLKNIPEIVAQEDRVAVVPLNKPDGTPDAAKDGSRATLSMVGMYSSVYREREQAFHAVRREATDEVPREEIEREVIARAITDWHGIEDDGVALACTPEHVRAVFEAAPWVFDQARVAFNQRGRFFDTASAD